MENAKYFFIFILNNNLYLNIYIYFFWYFIVFLKYIRFYRRKEKYNPPGLFLIKGMRFIMYILCRKIAKKIKNKGEPAGSRGSVDE